MGGSSRAIEHVRRRVVVSGMGAVSPLGTTLVDSWKQIIGSNDNNNDDDGHQQRRRTKSCGVTTLEEALSIHQDLSPDRFEREWKIARSLPCQVAAPVKDLKDAFLEKDPRCNPRTTARFIQLALLAGSEAMQQADLINWVKNDDGEEKELTANDYNYKGTRRERFGVCVGSGMSGVRDIVSAWDTVNLGGGIRKLSPHFIPKVLTNSASGRLSLEYGLRGPNLAPSTACAASAHAIGDAVRTIRSGAADLMLAGGSEASIEPLGLAGFCRLRALSTSFNNSPTESSRPFDSARDGFVMGEGSAILVLEELEHAKERIRRSNGTARILAEVTGYAATGDSFHVTAPDEAGRGAERAMMLALEDDAQLAIGQVPIGYVNAHATSTPKGDQIEAAVVDRVLRFHHNKRDILSDAASMTQHYMSSTKGATGHLLGAAGALEAAFTVMTLIDQMIPPTLNLNQPDDDNVSQPKSFRHVSGGRAIKPSTDLQSAISNSFGFGGTNASLVFRRYQDEK